MHNIILGGATISMQNRQTDRQTYIWGLYAPPLICPLWTQGLRCDPPCHLQEASCAQFFQRLASKILVNPVFLLFFFAHHGVSFQKWVHNAARGAQMSLFSYPIMHKYYWGGAGRQKEIHMGPSCNAHRWVTTLSLSWIFRNFTETLFKSCVLLVVV